MNKKENKFNLGDWIISKSFYDIVQIKEFTEDEKVWFTNGTGTFIEFLKDYRLWSINDAKDGDVLVCEDYGYTTYLLLKSFSNKIIKLHCWYNEQTNNLHNGTEVIIREDARIHPATKEQRDLLFSKMKEEGLEWDAEKKELKKIEQKQVIDYLDSLPKDNWELVHEFVNKFGRIPEDEDELNALVEYVLKRQKPNEWSEEDEKIYNEILCFIANASAGFLASETTCKTFKKWECWLKSFK